MGFNQDAARVAARTRPHPDPARALLTDWLESDNIETDGGSLDDPMDDGLHDIG